MLQHQPKQFREVTVLKETADLWSPGISCSVRGVAEAGKVSLLLDGVEMLSVQDDGWLYGMAGVYQRGKGAVSVGRMHITT